MTHRSQNKHINITPLNSRATRTKLSNDNNNSTSSMQRKPFTQPRRIKERISPEHIRIQNFEAGFNTRQPTKIQETSELLTYKTTPFTVSCEIILDKKNYEAASAFSIGFIQACHFKDVANIYGLCGSSKWELHPLKGRKHYMVSDSSEQNKPFYDKYNGAHHQKAASSVAPFIKRITMEDTFMPTIHWQTNHIRGCNCPLTKINRSQGFFVWLVFIEWKDSMSSRFLNNNIKSLHVLKTISWDYQLNLAIDIKRPLGKRVEIVNETLNKPVFHFHSQREIPNSAMMEPYCNSVQSLIFYPTEFLCSSKDDAIPQTVIYPKESIVEMLQWANDMFQIRFPLFEESFSQKKRELYLGELRELNEAVITYCPKHENENHSTSHVPSTSDNQSPFMKRLRNMKLYKAKL